MVKLAHIFTCHCWLLFCIWKSASSPKELLSSLLFPDPPQASRSSKKRQPLESQPATVGAPFLGQASWPSTEYARIVSGHSGVFLSDPELRQAPSPTPSRSFQGQALRGGPQIAGLTSTDGMEDTVCWNQQSVWGYTCLWTEPQARSPARDTEVISEARRLTVLGSQVGSLFLLRMTYSFLYFREMLPRE